MKKVLGVGYNDPMTLIAAFAHIEISKIVEELESSSIKPYPSDLSSYEEWVGILNKILFSLYEVAMDYPGEMEFFKKVGPYIIKDLPGGGCEVISTGIEMDKEGFEKYHNKIQEGLDLFGKYFKNLWA